MWILLIIGFGLIVLAAILLWTGRATQRLVNILKKAVPTTAHQVGDAFPGELVSITGAARSDTPLLSEHTRTPCLYYSCAVERDYERTEHHAATKDQPARTTTHRETETVSSNTQSAAFVVEDNSGLARVIPDDAEFDARETLNRFEPANGSGGSFSLGGFSINLGSGDRTIGYRYRESIIPLDEPVYVLGVVTEDGEIARPGQDHGDTALIISYRSRDALIEDWQSSARWQAYGAIGSATAGIALVVVAGALSIF